MAGFEGEGRKTPPLNTVLSADFTELRAARIDQYVQIEKFFGEAGPDFPNGLLRSTNNQGKEYTVQAALAVAHLFNHQIHRPGRFTVSSIPDSKAQRFCREPAVSIIMSTALFTFRRKLLGSFMPHAT